ncbi:MAG: transcription-repair coupling factor [Coriobacteriales bacterium]
MALINALIDELDKSRVMHEMFMRLDAGENPTLATPPMARVCIVASVFSRNPRPMLVVISGEEAARKFAMGLALYIGRENVLTFPMEDQLPWSDKDPSVDIVGKRLRALAALHSGENKVVVSSTRSLMRCYPPEDRMVFGPIDFRAGEQPSGLEYEQLPSELERLGYHREDQATEKGTFSIRGDSMDIFSSDAICPVRIEFFGDEVDRIRKIVPSTGQTVCDLDEVSIYPSRDAIVSERDVFRAKNKLKSAGVLTYDIEAELESISTLGIHGSQSRYVPFLFESTSTPIEFLNDETLTVMIEPRSLFDDSMRYYDELKAASKSARVPLDGLFCSPADLKFDKVQMFSILSLVRSGTTVDGELKVSRAESALIGDKFIGQLRSLLVNKYTVVLGVVDRSSREDLELLLTDEHIPITESHGDDIHLVKDSINVVDSPIAQGFVAPAAKLALFNTGDELGAGRDAVSPRSSSTEITFPYKPGDYVVHSKHGVAYFSKMEKQEVDGIWRDYLVLEYAAGDKLFIPVEQIGKITKYVGSNGEEPKLTRLDTNDWGRARAKASKAAKKLAFDLVDLYVRRSSVQGHAYSPDTEMQKQMEDLFPYEETSDQAKAIADVKADMESSKPMDRLICGDVGFGKTEVAIRAAFKAVQDGMQVMVLCPTTILAQQHYTTFRDRFEDFPVNVDILSRFRSPSQQRKALEGFSNGTLDVLVGTHRLLNRDVSPKSLGLVIIDEEQKFGVKHKEQLKNLREHIDVLTLTATPIPRTLQMSLGGVREMSLINTPPSFRIPVEVYVGEWDEGIVGGAIRREIQRGGQVYYVASRIKDIDAAVEKVTELVPEARVAFAHGRMGEDRLEDIMERFSAGEIDVLVSTTIVESGLDNPHTNTLIIEDSHMLGLSQLYQLKGRVGRSHVKAYAYFMFPQDMQLTEDAVSRLMAIKENQDFGSGIKIAMRDLEIRGAGSLLGAEQSGNISAIGFEAFTAMLSDYVSEARGNPAPGAFSDVVIDLPDEVYLPDDYIELTEDRVGVYRRFSMCRTVGDVEHVSEEMIRTYGTPPKPALNLVSRAYLQVLMADSGMKTISYVGGKVTFDPIDLDIYQRHRAKVLGATYFAKTKKMTYRPEGTEDIFEQVLSLLRDVLAADADTEDFDDVPEDGGTSSGREQILPSGSRKGRGDRRKLL